MNVPSLVLKIIVCSHFFLSVWGTMGYGFMPISYVYVHIGVLLCGLWAIGVPESADAVVMMLVTLGFSILQDIILLGLYEPRGYAVNESRPVTASALNEYRFALGMSILNLILKPVSVFLLFRVYQARSSETAFTIPGIERIPGLGGMRSGGYEDLESTRPSAPYSGMPVETASHHTTITK
ncbi:type-1 angiotensin II receptor-associated protein-like [Babylonia areolata]|uniref:type-1 angiotensin II receptor-associated protein-like n=1 Tax=Babylonia areolata TaxID=304850 RepID=UPI003FD29360